MNFYLDAADRFTATVQATADWSAASPCEEWTAADVVDHVVDTEREFLDRHDAELGERPSGQPPEVWAAHLAAVRPLVADEAFARAGVRRVLRPYDDRRDPAELLRLRPGRARLGPRAPSNGRPTTFTEADMDAMDQAFEGFGDHAYDEGVFRPAVEVADDAPRQERLLARMGRRSFEARA